MLDTVENFDSIYGTQQTWKKYYFTSQSSFPVGQGCPRDNVINL